MARKWYDVKAAADGKAVEVSIYDEIGAWGTSARSFLDALKPFKSTPVNLSINSPGGSLFDALAMFNGLRNHGAPITVQVMGVAASAASIVAMAGDTVRMPANTYMMIHKPLVLAYGNADEMREMADTLDKLGESLVATYSSRTGKTADEIRALLNEGDVWLTAAEAVEAGFADEVTAAFAATASFNVEHLPENVPEAVRAMLTPKAEGDKPGESKPKADGDDGAPAADPEPPLAEQIEAMAAAADMGDYAAAWALKFDAIAPVHEAITAAREIRVLCRLAKAEDKAAGFIAQGTPVAEVRTALCNARAAADEATHTDTARRNSNAPKVPAEPAAVTTAAVWAAHRKP